MVGVRCSVWEHTGDLTDGSHWRSVPEIGHVLTLSGEVAERTCRPGQWKICSPVRSSIQDLTCLNHLRLCLFAKLPAHAFLTARVGSWLQAFKEKVVEECATDTDFVWIHDYHLLVLPSLLRKRFNKVTKEDNMSRATP